MTNPWNSIWNAVASILDGSNLRPQGVLSSVNSYARGSLVDPSTGTVIDLARINSERNEIEGGVWFKKVVAVRSAGVAIAGIWGRAREVIIEGHKVGNMSEIEQFLRPIEQWMNVSGLQDSRAYFPFHHAQGPGYNDGSYVSTYSNPQASGIDPTQRYFYYVICDHFSWQYDDKVRGKINYLLVLREGVIFGGFNNSTPT